MILIHYKLKGVGHTLAQVETPDIGYQLERIIGEGATDIKISTIEDYE